MPLYHIAVAAEWAAARCAGHYVPGAFQAEGFIHLSHPHQILWVANTRYAGRHDLVLLRIRGDRLEAELREENLEGGTQMFPHLYGVLPLDAVAEVLPFDCDPQGRFDHHHLDTD